MCIDTGVIVKRVGRVCIDLLIAGLVIKFTNNEIWIFLVPLLAGLGKLLRSKFNLLYIPF